jgi:hypothetical protein
MKESQYDTTIDRVAVETAYRVLSDIATKAQYDSRQTLRMKRQQGKVRFGKKSSAGSLTNWFTVPRLLAILGICLLLTGGFYWARFGYKLKDFQAGDVLYDRVTNTRYGKIVRVEKHTFAEGTGQGYLIELDKSQFVLGVNSRSVWIQQDVIKAKCYKP